MMVAHQTGREENQIEITEKKHQSKSYITYFYPNSKLSSK
jgi:hypothetical protein